MVSVSESLLLCGRMDTERDNETEKAMEID